MGVFSTCVFEKNQLPTINIVISLAMKNKSKPTLTKMEINV